MADQTLQMEARLRNFVSGELGKIKTDLRSTEVVAQKSTRIIAKGGSQIGDAFDYSERKMKAFAGRFIGLGAGFMIAQTAISKMTNELRESVKAYEAFGRAAGDVQVQKMDELREKHELLRMELGDKLYPVWVGMQQAANMWISGVIELLGKIESVQNKMPKSSAGTRWTQTPSDDPADYTNGKFNGGGPTIYKTQSQLDAEKKAGEERMKAADKIKQQKLENDWYLYEVDKGMREKSEDDDRKRVENMKSLNDDILKIEIELRDSMIKIEEEKTEARKKEAEERQEIAEREFDANYNMVQSLIDLGFTSVMAANKNKEEQRKIAATESLIQGLLAGGYASVKVWQSSKTWQEGLAAQIAVAASTTAQAIASVAAINSAATGADFVTSGKQLLLVGDNPSGREHVQVTPMGSSGTTNNSSNATFNVNVSGGSRDTVDYAIRELEQFAKKYKRAQYEGFIK